MNLVIIQSHPLQSFNKETFTINANVQSFINLDANFKGTFGQFQTKFEGVIQMASSENKTTTELLNSFTELQTDANTLKDNFKKVFEFKQTILSFSAIVAVSSAVDNLFHTTTMLTIKIVWG